MEKPRKKELLPCPFCGEQPEKATATTPRGIIYFLECTNDKCPAHTVSVCGDHFEQSSINKWNTRAMSTWLEGEVPTEKEINEVIDRYMPCSCIDAYKKRNMSAPDCANCNHKEELSEAIHELIKRKLKGKV